MTTSKSVSRLLLLALVAVQPRPCVASRDTDVVSPPRTDAMATELDSLRSGGPAEKRLIVEDQLEWLIDLDFDDPKDDNARYAVAALRAILRTEPDEWIANRLLQSFADEEGELLDPVFLELLRDPSPNLRWSAIRYFQSRELAESVPLLEEAWRFEKRPWVLADLMDALSFNGSRRFRDDFRRFARSEDRVLSAAALDALLAIHDENCLDEMIRTAREGPRMREKAVGGLASWPDSSKALAALIDLSGSEDDGLARAAASALGFFSEDQAVRRLTGMVKEHAADSVRRAALNSLADRQPDGFSDLLLKLLSEPLAQEDLKQAALAHLRKVADASLLPQLEDLQLAQDETAPAGLDDLVSDLSGQDDDQLAEKNVILTDSCGMSFDLIDTALFHVEAARHQLSLRCWEFPAVPGDPEDFPRIPGGSVVRIEDHFELRGIPWVEIEGREVEDCWIPLEALVPLADGDVVTDEDSSPESLRREADVPLRELGSPQVDRLRKGGLLEIFDVSETVAAIALQADPARPESIRLLLETLRDDDSILSEEIQELLDAVREPDDGADASGDPARVKETLPKRE